MVKESGEWFYILGNEKTFRDSYPLPNIIDILDLLGSVRYFQS